MMAKKWQCQFENHGSHQIHSRLEIPSTQMGFLGNWRRVGQTHPIGKHHFQGRLLLVFGDVNENSGLGGFGANLLSQWLTF